MKKGLRQLMAGIIAVILVILSFTAVAAAPLQLPDLISDNMLIQRDMPIKLWGYGGTSGEELKVEIEDEKGIALSEGSTTIGDDGFKIELPSLAAGGPYTISFIDSAGKKLATVKNVLVGDLWFQGGQSNMQYRIYSVPNSVEERVNPNPKDDTIRLFYNGEHFSADTPATDLEGEWVVADKNLLEYSAVGYKALETIHNALDIPVGGICSPYGGTGLSAFNSENAAIYKAKVAPVTQFNIKGVMWYQGGTDSKGGAAAEKIESGYKQLVSLFREKWNNPNLPFMVVQLHQSKMRGLKYGSTTDYSITDYSPARIAQSNLYMSVDNVGMAVAMDLSLQKYKGDGEDPDHPWMKAPVGERLGNAALEMVYGKDIKSKSPVYTGFKIDGSEIKITVQDAYDGLKTSDGKAPWGFRIAGEDGVYYEAKASLSGNVITLTSADVPNPVSASYGIEKHIWPYTDLKSEDDIANAPELPEFLVNVVNSVGLPLGAFSTLQSYIPGSEAASEDVQAPSDVSGEKEEFIPVNTDVVVQNGDKTLIYVAKDGNDKNAGTVDKPLATVSGALAKVKALKEANAYGKDGIVVYIRGGEYMLEKTIYLDSVYGGTEEAPLTIRNYPGETVDFVGAATLSWSDFKPVKDEAVLSKIYDEGAKENLYAADMFKLGFTNLPEQTLPGSYSYWQEIGEYLAEKGVKSSEAKAPELIINGEAMTLARYPNDGYMKIGEVIEEGNREFKEPFEFVVDDPKVKNWVDAKDAILYGTFQYSWGTLSTFLGEVNTKKNSVKAKYPTWHTANKDQEFYIYNLIEEIDMPGEYYIDRDAGKLYIYAPDEDVETVMYTMLDQPMINFSGADYVSIKGINMKYTRHNFINIGNGSENCVISGCSFTYNSRGCSVQMNGKNNKVLDCSFTDCEGGVSVSGGDRATLTSGNNVVENCIFKNCERMTKSYMGAIFQSGVGNRVSYNDISDSGHLLVSFSGNFNELSYNNIHHGCKNTDDMGAVYSGRDLTQRGNLIMNNYIHDIGGANRGNEGVHGIFLDDFWSAADMVGNVFANITGSGVMFAGSYNVVNNNIFANVGTTGGVSVNVRRSYNYGNADSDKEFIANLNKVPYTSDVWLKAFPEMANVISKDGKLDMNNHIVVTNNVVYNSPEPQYSNDAKKTLTAENNIIFQGDPGFYDLDNEIYLLKEDSQVFEKIPDFKSIPFTRIGTYSERAVSRAKKGYVFCTDSPYVMQDGKVVKTDKTQVIAQNDTLYVPLRSGADAVKATLVYDEEKDRITVTGKGKVLEFTDGATDTVEFNGTDYALAKPIVNINGSNYISITDLVNMFEQYLINSGDAYIITDYKDLFTHEADSELLRYIEAQLTVY